MLHWTSGREGHDVMTADQTQNVPPPAPPMMINVTSGRSGHEVLSLREERIHVGIICDHCETENIQGTRYKCLCCPNYDLCQNCIVINEDSVTQFHPEGHYFIRLKETKPSLPALPMSPSAGFPGINPTWNKQRIPWLLMNRENMIHQEKCVHCAQQIIGLRYFCTSCAVNMCEACEVMSHTFHDVTHNLLKMQPPVAVATHPTTTTSASTTSMNLSPVVPLTSIFTNNNESTLSGCKNGSEFATHDADDQIGSQMQWRHAGAAYLQTAGSALNSDNDSSTYELVCAMLSRENKLRLSDSVNDCIRTEGSGAYGFIMDRVQRQVAAEFGFCDLDADMGLNLLRCCESMYERHPDRLKRVRELSYYRKFNRCCDGTVVVGQPPPALPPLHRFTSDLSPVNVLEEYYFNQQSLAKAEAEAGQRGQKPLILLAGSYS